MHVNVFAFGSCLQSSISSNHMKIVKINVYWYCFTCMCGIICFFTRIWGAIDNNLHDVKQHKWTQSCQYAAVSALWKKHLIDFSSQFLYKTYIKREKNMIIFCDKIMAIERFTEVLGFEKKTIRSFMFWFGCRCRPHLNFPVPEIPAIYWPVMDAAPQIAPWWVHVYENIHCQQQ